MPMSIPPHGVIEKRGVHGLATLLFTAKAERDVPRRPPNLGVRSWL